jgi:S-DNA-T family DNA segregation ATPase FtsK/SpoIIIE
LPAAGAAFPENKFYFCSGYIIVLLKFKIRFLFKIMATATSRNKQNTSSKPRAKQKPASSKRNIRLTLGFFLLLLGSFLTLSIISYCFSWQHDQDHVLNTRGIQYFLFRDDSVVSNWCGRLGAVAAHLLVFRGLGILSLLLTTWIAAWGINLIYGKRFIQTAKWTRWMALGFLWLCPLFSFIFAQSAFPLGGALGNGLVGWTNGFAGKAGSILMLLGIFCFFVFIVFQWDIKPLLLRAKKIIPKTGGNAPETTPDAFKGYRHFTPEEEAQINQAEQGSELQIMTGSRNKLKNDGEAVVRIAEADPTDDLGMTIIDKTGEAFAASRQGIHLELPEEPDPLDEAVEGPDLDAAVVEDDPLSLDFEIRTVEEEQTVPKQNAHISIESAEPYDPSLDLRNYKFPTLDLLEGGTDGAIALDREELTQNKNQIINTLRSFGIEIQQISATVGPTVTLYEIVPAEGVRISKIRNLEDDIALNLAALGIRIIAPIPGKGTIGIEVPNTNKQIVSMRTLLSSEKFINNKMSLPIALGKKIDNENYIVDLATMPHLLMAGATGQGKSVGINAILVSLLYKKHPSQLKFVMVDPKKVELSIYRVIEKHYLAMLPNEEEAIITDTKKVINTVNALCIEMDNRYELLKDAGARNIKEYNEKFIKRKLNPEHGHKYLPFIVLVIDEFADLIMTAGKEVEMPIARLAQLARAVGIHIIIATQRPSVNVITGIIKANFPARIAFKVSAKVDSRTILDAGGAEQLIGRGDMLVSHGSELLRLQCAFVDTPEVERIVQFIGEQQGYPSAFLLPEYEGAEDEREKDMVDLTKRDKMFEECARLVVNSQSGSTSMLQRKFNLGYNRAGRIMDQLEAAGVVGGASGSKPRDVMIKTEYELEQHLRDLF